MSFSLKKDRARGKINSEKIVGLSFKLRRTDVYIFGIISMLLFTFCFIPQISTILKTRNVSGISMALLVMVVAAHATGLLYVIGLKDAILITSYSIGFLLSSWVLILVVSLRKG